VVIAPSVVGTTFLKAGSQHERENESSASGIGLSVLLVAASQLAAQGGPPWLDRGWPWPRTRCGRPGGGFGRGAAWAGPGAGADAQFVADRDVFHFLLQNHDQIRRNVKNTKTGVETLTESDKPEIAAKLQEHVAAMAKRVEEQRPIHMRDPLFAELFRHTARFICSTTRLPRAYAWSKPRRIRTSPS